LVRLGALGMLLADCRPRPSSVPLGGKRDVVTAEAKKSERAEAAAGAMPVSNAADAQEVARAETVEVAPAAAPPPPTQAEGKPAAPGAFVVAPFSAHQAWTRVFDMEFNLKVGPGGSVDMKMTSHQEARFEVLSVSNGSIDKLGIEYAVYASKMSAMGNTQDSPEELAGKRFVITFSHGNADVRDASGGTPPKKQVDSVKDDAREPLELEKAMKELSQLTAKGTGDFSTTGAVSLAGGEDDDTKVTRAKASLQQLRTGSHAERTALLDLGYTLTNTLDDNTVIEVQVAGTVTVQDGPARVMSSLLQGPMELRSPDPGGMQGRGTIKVTTSYRY